MAVPRLVSGVTGLAGTTGVIPQETPGGRPGKGFGSQTPSDASEAGSGTAEKRPASPAERRPRRPAGPPAVCPRPAVGKPVLLPVGWAPARPCQTPERPAGVPWPRQGARLPTHCRDGRRAGAGPNQAEASGKRKPCAGAWAAALARDKAGEARRCPGGHSQCVSPECGLTPKALRSDPGGSSEAHHSAGSVTRRNKEDESCASRAKSRKKRVDGEPEGWEGALLVLTSPCYTEAGADSLPWETPGRWGPGLASGSQEHRTYRPLGLRRGRQTPVSQEGCRRAVRGLPCPEEPAFRAEDHAE